MSKEVTVSELPACQIANDCNVPAEYDFKTQYGPWAYACRKHWEQARYFPTLGTGKGQHLVVEE